MYGKVGVLNYDEVEDKVECHICGRWYRRLGKHIQPIHGLTPEEYKEEFGLNRRQSLACEGERRKLSELNKKHGNWRHLISQTITREELVAFLNRIRATTIDWRPQGRLSKIGSSKHLRNAQSIAKSLAARREKWYGTPAQRAQSRLNQQAAAATRRGHNLGIRKWACPCGEVFATREKLRVHQKEGH